MKDHKIVETDAGPYGTSIEVELGGIRPVIARNLTKAHQVPTAGDGGDANVTPLYLMRERLKPEAERKGVKLTYTPFFISAAVYALQQVPYFNATIKDDSDNHFFLHQYYNIGYAVNRDEGLVVLNVKNADQKSLWDIAQEIEMKSERVRENMNFKKGDSVTLEDFQGGTFTISNVGGKVQGSTYISKTPDPLLNFPEVAILGIGVIYDHQEVKGGKVVEKNGKLLLKGGEVSLEKRVPLKLNFDHRLNDGILASELINQFAHFLGSEEELTKLVER